MWALVSERSDTTISLLFVPGEAERELAGIADDEPDLAELLSVVQIAWDADKEPCLN